jgi:hypothetical protein
LWQNHSGAFAKFETPYSTVAVEIGVRLRTLPTLKSLAHPNNRSAF